MTTKLPNRDVDEIVDVDLNSRDVLVGGCLRGIVTDRKLPTHTGKEYKFFSLNGYKREFSCRKTAAQSRGPTMSSWLETQLLAPYKATQPVTSPQGADDYGG